MKSVFSDLKKVLNEKEVDYDKYACDITKLFISDLFTLDNKINKYDVGGFDYIYPDKVDNYKLNVTNTLYKYMENNINGNRKQKLPVVSDVLINDEKDLKYKIGEDEFDAKELNIEIKYESDLGYDDKAKVICIIKDKKVYIAEYKVED